ncbi:Sodium/hydrogen exchanger family-domain-containing protein [Xylariaceae sp. FL0016]|nr:Sodium/hydrogen exchanger family-domain-containing protein [Xylariaceae sp. FL0016]
MPKLDTSNFNVVLTFAGGWISLFGLVSYLLKEHFSLSEAFISLCSGVAFGPHGANFIRPLHYAGGSVASLERLNLDFTRLVLGVQLVLAGIQLPSRYLQKEFWSILLLVGPILTTMWLVTSCLIWGLVPDLPILHALAVGACVAPTDPVLSAVVIKGRFADENIPVELQRVIIAESGTNDGLGYPFLFFALYLIQQHREGPGPAGEVANPGVGWAMRMWFGETWGWVVLFSIAYGFAVGYAAKVLLYGAQKRGFVDRESFLIFAVSIALFITGSCGLLGTDDVLACFVAGNAFTWDDWFRQETVDDSLQPTVDMILNVAIFIWLGAVCPWHLFAENSVISLPRLVALGILVLLLRRLPIVMMLHRFIPQVKETRQALFVGFFGPIGVSAIFYLYLALEFVQSVREKDPDRSDLDSLGETFFVVVWFLAVCSIVVHGLSIPLGKLGFFLPQKLFAAPASNEENFENREGGADEEEPLLIDIEATTHKIPSQPRHNPDPIPSNSTPPSTPPSLFPPRQKGKPPAASQINPTTRSPQDSPTCPASTRPTSSPPTTPCAPTRTTPTGS